MSLLPLRIHEAPLLMPRCESPDVSLSRGTIASWLDQAALWTPQYGVSSLMNALSRAPAHFLFLSLFTS